MIQQLHTIGIRHVELAWSEGPGWIDLCLRIQELYPSLLIGGVSVCARRALDDCAAAGVAYAIAPILDPDLVRQAERLGITLVPGVMTPTEVVRARHLGCRMVKLFPAARLGIGYWRQLAGPPRRPSLLHRRRWAPPVERPRLAWGRRRCGGTRWSPGRSNGAPCTP